MNYKVIDNFLDIENCNQLIKDGYASSNLDKYQKMHNNRYSLVCSNLEFFNLCKKSKSWLDLQEKLSSEAFFKKCCSMLDLDSEQFEINNHFKKLDLNDNEKLFKSIGRSNCNLLNTKSLIKFSLFRFYKRVIRKIKFSKIFYLKKKPVELLYDYSVAGDGYKREIHRDSDSRIIVFLLYLNELDKQIEGGNLEIYKPKKQLEKPMPRPEPSSCELVEKIEPAAGKLVIFQNNDTSYHSVSELKKSKNNRNFIYGGFTLLAGKNPYIKNRTKLATEFHLYE